MQIQLKNTGCTGAGFIITEYAVSPRENTLFVMLEIQHRMHAFPRVKCYLIQQDPKESIQLPLQKPGCAGVGVVIPECAVSPRGNTLFVMLEIQHRKHVFPRVKLYTMQQKSQKSIRIHLQKPGCAGVGFVTPECAVSPRETTLFVMFGIQHRMHVFPRVK